MPIHQTLTDEQAASIWAGDTASIINFGNDEPEVTTEEPEVKTVETDNDDSKKVPKVEIKPEDLDNLFAEKTEDEEDEDQDEVPNNKIQNQQSQQDDAKPKSGRKPTDLVNVVNQLIEDEVLFGFEGEEIKTIDDVKELIKANLKYKEENSFDDLWKRKVESYNPQVQAILHYAEKGGQDITPLLNAMNEVEQSSSINIETEEGQEETIRQVLKIKGFDDEEIKDQIETFKDLDKLKSKAEKFKPELDKLKEQRINLMLREQEEREQQAKEAARIYIETVQNTLSKDDVGGLRLKREEKAKVLDALALPKYRSINGYAVNEFVKVLEELQFGKNANYDHFLNIVHFAVDRDGFFNKIKESIKNDVTAETVKKLKTSKTTTANTEQNETTSTSRKNVISRAGFRNPFT